MDISVKTTMNLEKILESLERQKDDNDVAIVKMECKVKVDTSPLETDKINDLEGNLISADSRILSIEKESINLTPRLEKVEQYVKIKDKELDDIRNQFETECKMEETENRFSKLEEFNNEIKDKFIDLLEMCEGFQSELEEINRKNSHLIKPINKDVGGASLPPQTQMRSYPAVQPPTRSHSAVPPPTRSYSAVPPPTRSYSAVPSPTRSYSAVPPPTRSYFAVPPPTRSHSAVQPPTRSYSAVPPPTRSHSAVLPPTRSYSSPPTRSHSAVPPPTRSYSAVPPPTRSYSAVPPPTKSQSAVPPPTKSQSVAQPITRSYSAVPPPTKSQSAAQPITRFYSAVPPPTRSQYSVPPPIKSPCSAPPSTKSPCLFAPCFDRRGSAANPTNKNAVPPLTKSNEHSEIGHSFATSKACPSSKPVIPSKKSAQVSEPSADLVTITPQKDDISLPGSMASSKMTGLSSLMSSRIGSGISGMMYGTMPQATQPLCPFPEEWQQGTIPETTENDDDLD